MAEDLGKFKVGFEVDTNAAIAQIQRLQEQIDKWKAAMEKPIAPAAMNSFNLLIQSNQREIDKLSAALETNTTQSYNNFRAIGQMDRITREFASGGLNQGLNGLTMFGNTLTRLAVQEGGFKNAIAGLASAFTGPAGIVLGVSAAIGIFEVYEKSTKKAADEQEKFAKSLEDSKKQAVEQTGHLQTLISIASSANATDMQRAKALQAVKNEISQVNKEYANQINTVSDAEEVVKNYTKALIQQAIVERYQKEIADKSVDLAQTQINITRARTNFLKEQASIKPSSSIGASMELQEAANTDKLTYAAKYLREEKEKGIEQSNRIFNLNKQMQSAIEVGVKMPFFTNLETNTGEKTKTDNSLDDEIRRIERKIQLTKEWANEELRLYKQRNDFFKKEGGIAKADTGVSNFNKYLNDQDLKRKEKESIPTLDNLKLPKDLPNWFNNYTEAVNKNDEALKKQAQDYSKFASMIARDVTGALKSAWDAIQKGESPLEAIGNAFIKIGEDIAFAVLEATIFKALLEAFPELKGVFATVGAISGALSFGAHAEGGITTGPSLGLIGEAGPEAILPLSKLGSMMNSTFNAGAMSGGGGGGNGQFVLKGNDLVLALQRSNYSLNLRRGA